MSRSEKRKRWMMYAAAALLCLTLVSICATGKLYARYTTQVSVSDGARVARFAVSVAPANESQGKDSLGTLKKGESASYQFTVSNKDGSGNVCETAAQYDVVVTLPEATPGLTLTLQSSERAATFSPEIDNKVYTFSNVGNFPAGEEKTHTLTLTFTVGDGAANAELKDIKIEVTAAQTD